MFDSSTQSFLVSQIAFVLLLLLSVGATTARAQVSISGTVVDAESSDPLPAAGIRIDGTALGTITNNDGAFSLRITQLPATVIFRYVGYQSESVRVSAGSETNLTIRLRPTVVGLDEVVVTGENPAIDIMRNVIQRKLRMRAELETYQADAYNRFTISNDTGVVSILESFTEAYWKVGEGLREAVIDQRQTRNMEFDELLPAAMLVANLYDDDIEIAGFNVRGVTHPDALDHYRFVLANYVYLDDKLVYEIGVEPRNSRKTGFKGMLRVLADEYVLLEVNLTPGKAVYLPPPFENFQTVLYQQYSDFGNGQWLPSDLHSNTKIKISFGPLFEFPEIQVEQISRLSNYATNVEVPDSLFERSPEEVVESGTKMTDEELSAWSVPLTTRELDAFEEIDSTDTLEKAFKPTGLLGKVANLEFSTGSDSDTEGTSESDGPFGSENMDTRFLPAVAYNRVEGFRAGVDLVVEGEGSGLEYETRVGGSYRTASKMWGYGIGAGVMTGKRIKAGLNVEYANEVATRYDDRVYSEAAASVMSLFGHPDYFDYYGRKGFTITPSIYASKIKTSVAATYNAAVHSSLDRNTSYDLVGRAKVQRENPAIAEGDMKSVKLEVVVNAPETSLPVAGSRSVRLTAEHSNSSSLNSDFDFTVATAQADWRIKTFHRRRLLAQTLDIRFVASISDEVVPAQRLHTIDASNGIYTPFGSLRSAGDRPFEGDETIAVFWEHNFRSSLFELIGAWGVARTGITFTVFGGHGMSSIRQDVRSNLTFDPVETDGWYHEVGLSVGGLLGMIRLDVAKQVGGSNYGIGVGVARLF